MICSILEQSFLFLPLTLGLYVSYGILRIPDLATDGSFVLGAALFGYGISHHFSPLCSIFIAVLGGIAVGITTSTMQTHLKLNPLIAGILIVFILNTLVMKIMGRPNLSLLNYPSIFESHSRLLIIATLGVATLLICGFLFFSKIGLMLNAFGNNPVLLNLSGKNANYYRTLGLSISNGLVAYTGSISAQANGYIDIGMGTGIVLIAIGTVIIGQQLFCNLFKKFSQSSFLKLFCCLLGVILYFSIINILISLGFDPIYLRLLMGICLIIFLALAREKKLKESA